MDIINKVKNTIERYSLLSHGDRVLVALSGGPDSVCLLHIACELRSDLALTLSAVYVDHGLRPDEIPGEISFCKRLCEDLGMDFSVRKIDLTASPLVKKLGKQGAARELRYHALEEAAVECSAEKIALAHHRDDQVETFLINLLRGAGMRGVAGMPVQRGRIIRPLFDVEKTEITAYLDSINAGFVTDSSNLKTDSLRNVLRSRIIPALKELNPKLSGTISTTAALLTEENEYLDIQVTKTMLRLFSRKSRTRIELFLSPLETLPTVILRRVLRRVIAEIVSLRALSYRHIEDIIGLIKDGVTGSRLSLPHDLRIIREYSLLVLTVEEPVTLETVLLDIGEERYIENIGMVFTAGSTKEPVAVDEKRSALFDRSKVTLPLTIRSRREGDHFYPSGFGKKKKIQDFFVDEKVPRDERDAVPLICSGEHIIWIAGYRADDRFLPDEKTRDFLFISAKPAGK